VELLSQHISIRVTGTRCFHVVPPQQLLRRQSARRVAVVDCTERAVNGKIHVFVQETTRAVTHQEMGPPGCSLPKQVFIRWLWMFWSVVLLENALYRASPELIAR